MFWAEDIQKANDKHYVTLSMYLIFLVSCTPVHCTANMLHENTCNKA